MRCLVVGTDRLGTAPQILKERFGVTEILHCNGRERLQETKNISLMVIYVGFANHTIVKQAKKMAKKNKIKTIFVNRGLSELVTQNQQGGPAACIGHISAAFAVRILGEPRSAT